MAHQHSLIDYEHGDTPLEGYLAWDDSIEGPRPAVLVTHMWSGRVPFVCHVADRLAELGYAAMALDMFGKGVFGSNNEENLALMTPFLEDRALLLARMQRALEVLKAQPQVDSSKIVASGYCFGGLCVLDLARSGADVLGVVSFHGLLHPPEGVEKGDMKARVLALNGDRDPMVPAEKIIEFQDEMTAAGVDWQFVNYGNTLHAFTNPEASDSENGMVFNALADRRSWVAFVNFLEETFA